MKPSLPYTSQIQINLGLTLRAVKRKVEEEKCLFALCFSALLKLLLFVQEKIWYLKAIFSNMKYRDKQKETAALLTEMWGQASNRGYQHWTNHLLKII